MLKYKIFGKKRGIEFRFEIIRHNFGIGACFSVGIKPLSVEAELDLGPFNFQIVFFWNN